MQPKDEQEQKTLIRTGRVLMGLYALFSCFALSSAWLDIFKRDVFDAWTVVMGLCVIYGWYKMVQIGESIQAWKQAFSAERSSDAG